ncbi:MAG: hypothetical protein OEW42_10780, partial [Acidimicrobiia bacterium]|nr:hypothetical protein [Acidimicrobiia bacterium]
MKNRIRIALAAMLTVTLMATPAMAATPPDYGDALDCLFVGLTNGPDSDPDMVAALDLTFQASIAEAAGDLLGAADLLAQARDLLEDAQDTTPADCTGAMASTTGDLPAT